MRERAIRMGDVDETARLKRRVSELRAELEHLRKRDALLSAAIDASPTGVVIVGDDSGLVEFCNSAGSCVASEGKPISSRPLQASRKDGTRYSNEELPVMRAFRRGETVDGEVVILDFDDGRRMYAEAFASPVRDETGDIVAACVVFADVTERQLAEQRAERFRLIAESSPDFIGMANLNGEVFYVNPGGRTLCEIAPGEDVTGRPLSSFHPPEVAEHHFQEAWSTAIREGVWQGTTSVATRSGNLIPVSQLIMAHGHEDGRPAYMSTVMRDLRQLRRLEEQLLHRQKLEAVGRLAGGIAHDFNNMLFVINNYVSMAIDSLEPGDPIRDDLNLALDAGSRSTALCSQLLGFARKQIIAPEVMSPNDVLRDFRRFITHIIGEHIQLEFVLGDAVGNVRIDPAQFDQIVTNLAVNARDAQPDGGRLTIETANVVLDSHYVESFGDVSPGPYVMLAVSDRGGGMPREVLEHAFEPFFSTKEPGAGTGLGLATVFGAVKQNGGHVVAYSEVGFGTTVKVYLPRVDEGIEARPAGPETFERATETILVVEDEPLVRGLTVRLLESAGYRVLEANSGRDALIRAREFQGPVELLLTDVVMPEMSGPALARRLGKERPEMRVLFASGYTDQVIVHHGVLETGVQFVSKPYDRVQLLTRIRDVLDAGQERISDAEEGPEGQAEGSVLSPFRTQGGSFDPTGSNGGSPSSGSRPTGLG